MYMNLQAEMLRRNIKREDLAKFLGIRASSISNKINGKHYFKFNEAMEIKKEFFPELTLDYLFELSDIEKNK